MKHTESNTIHCSLHNANTTIGKCDMTLPPFFAPDCFFCIHERLGQMTIEYNKVRDQRDTLVKAMSIVQITKELI